MVLLVSPVFIQILCQCCANLFLLPIIEKVRLPRTNSIEEFPVCEREVRVVFHSAGFINKRFFSLLQTWWFPANMALTMWVSAILYGPQCMVPPLCFPETHQVQRQERDPSSGKEPLATKKYFLLPLYGTWCHWVLSLVSMFLPFTFFHVASTTPQLLSTALSYILEFRDYTYLPVSPKKKRDEW